MKKLVILMVALFCSALLGIMLVENFKESAPQEVVEPETYTFPLLEDINGQVAIMKSIRECIETQSVANTALQEENRKLKEEISSLKEDRNRLITEKNNLIKEQEELMIMIDEFKSYVL